MADIILRRAVPGDLPQIIGIYNPYIRDTIVTFEVDEVHWRDRRDWFAQFKDNGPYQMFVAERDFEVIGYAYMGPFRPREGWRPSAECTIYLKMGGSGNGLGTRLYETLFSNTLVEPLHRVYAGIGLPNDASVALHRKFGFKELVTFNEGGLKFGKRIDVLFMEKRLG